MKSRQAALAAAVGGLLLLTLGARLLWPSVGPTLTCPPGEVRLDDAGVARCAPGETLPAGQAMTVGQKVDLNRASAADLALVPGVGPSLAQALVEARDADGGFANWGQVDGVPGVGPVRLEALRTVFEIRPADGGSW